MDWQLDMTLAEKVASTINRTEQDISRPLRIISGFRTAREQQALIDAGRPAAPVNVSNHTLCPARAVDISLGPFPTVGQKQVFGFNAQLFGLRWGGGSELDQDRIPSDWQHLDLGPRR